MALSNWDTLALDHQGKPCAGSFTSPGGVTVEFYKNWIYVAHPAAWQEKGGFCRPTVMEVRHGGLRYHDVHIEAVRGPKDGIYAAVWSRVYPPHEPGKPYPPGIVTGMVGIGCYGYKNEVDLVLAKLGRVREPGDFWMAAQNYYDGKIEEHFIENIRDGKVVEKIVHEGYDLEELWCGIEAAEVAFLKTFLADERRDIPDPLRKLDLGASLRFNQGDAFFAAHLEEDIPASAPGEAAAPVISKLLGEEKG